MGVILRGADIKGADFVLLSKSHVQHLLFFACFSQVHTQDEHNPFLEPAKVCYIASVILMVCSKTKQNTVPTNQSGDFVQ